MLAVSLCTCMWGGCWQMQDVGSLSKDGRYSYSSFPVVAGVPSSAWASHVTQDACGQKVAGWWRKLAVSQMKGSFFCKRKLCFSVYLIILSFSTGSFIWKQVWIHLIFRFLSFSLNTWNYIWSHISQHVYAKGFVLFFSPTFCLSGSRKNHLQVLL